MRASACQAVGVGISLHVRSLPVSRLLAANIFNLFLKEVFLTSVILFQSDFCFMKKDLRFRLRSFEFRRCGKVDKKDRRSLKICSRASCAGHSTKRPSS